MLHCLKYIKQHKWSICVQLDTIKRDHIATIGWVEGAEWGRKNIPKLRKDKDVEKKEEWVKTSIHNNEFFSTYGIFILFFSKCSAFLEVKHCTIKNQSWRTRWLKSNSSKQLTNKHQSLRSLKSLLNHFCFHNLQSYISAYCFRILYMFFWWFFLYFCPLLDILGARLISLINFICLRTCCLFALLVESLVLDQLMRRLTRRLNTLKRRKQFTTQV